IERGRDRGLMSKVSAQLHIPVTTVDLIQLLHIMKSFIRAAVVYQKDTGFNAKFLECRKDGVQAAAEFCDVLFLIKKRSSNGKRFLHCGCVEKCITLAGPLGISIGTSCLCCSDISSSLSTACCSLFSLRFMFGPFPIRMVRGVTIGRGIMPHQ